jgi:hypothetical protein
MEKFREYLNKNQNFPKMKKTILMLLTIAAISSCKKSSSPANTTTTKTTTDSGTFVSATWTLAGANYSATKNNMTQSGSVVGGTCVNPVCTITVFGGANQFPTGNDTFMIVEQAQTVFYPKSLSVSILINYKEYSSFKEPNQANAIFSLNNGNLRITIPQIWIYNIANAFSDSMQLSANISQ